jgi:hypothetical protein
VEEEKKTCTKCLESKPISKFGRSKSVKGGITYWCHDCWRSYHNEYRRKNRELIRERNRDYSIKYYSTHKEQIKETRAKQQSQDDLEL